MNIKQLLKDGIKNKSFTIGAVIFLGIVFLAIFAEVIAPHSYREVNVAKALQPPGHEFLFGTDQYGRCILSRIIYGARIALAVGISIVIVQAFFGITLGLISGYFGKWVENCILFITDVTYSIPPLILALGIITMLGPSLINLVITLAAVGWASFSRVICAKTRLIKNMPYVEAARAFGESNFSIIMRYILPNVMPQIIVLVSLFMPSAILSTATLGFLGLGSRPPSPDWGVMLSESMNFIRNAPWMSIFPGITLVITVLSFNLIGEGIRDLIDPSFKA